ncbi:MAG: 50S ribosomal protein L21 [Bacteroidota bacterium]
MPARPCARRKRKERLVLVFGVYRLVFSPGALERTTFTMYAIFLNGGHQYVATENEIVRVEKFAAEPEASVVFDQVLAVRNGDDFKVGAPYVSGAKITGTVMSQGRSPKIIVFRYKPKKHYKKIKGHRQDYTEVRIKTIEV